MSRQYRAAEAAKGYRNSSALVAGSGLFAETMGAIYGIDSTVLIGGGVGFIAALLAAGLNIYAKNVVK